MRLDDALQTSVIREQLGHDLAVLVQRVQELKFMRFEREDHREQVPALSREIANPLVDIRSLGGDIGPQHREEFSLNLIRVRIHIAEIDLPPIPPAGGTIDDEAKSQTGLIQPAMLQELAGVEKVPAGLSPEESGQLPGCEFVDIEHGHLLWQWERPQFRGWAVDNGMRP